MTRMTKKERLIWNEGKVLVASSVIQLIDDGFDPEPLKEYLEFVIEETSPTNLEAKEN